MASLRRKLIDLLSLKKESGGGGGLPSEYQQVEYIESHGGQGSSASNRQYMMIDYVPNSKTGFEIEYKTTKTTVDTEMLFGSLSLDSNTVRTYSIRSQWNNTNSVVIRKYGTNYVMPATFNVKHNLVVDKNGNYNIDGTTGTATNFDDTFYDNISLFARIDTSTNNPTDFASLQLYKLKFYENDVLVRDFIPCYRKSDTTIGLYEVVNGAFYTNQGTGVFTKGADVSPVTSPIYGIKRALNANSSAWERTDDAFGLVANAQNGSTAVYNDFDRIYPWSDIISYNYDVTNDTINAYYGDSNFAFDGSNGDVLTLVPEFYYKRWQDSSYEYIQISKKSFTGSIKSEEFSIGRYLMSGSSSRVYSRSGYSPLTSQTIANFRTYANNLGAKFSQLDWHIELIQMLYLVEYADYDSQTKLGKGYAGSHSATINSGGCDFLGMKSGSQSKTSYNYSVIYRGIEDIFGNVQQFVDGVNVNGNNMYVCYDKTKYANNQYSGDYTLLGYQTPSHTGAGGGTISIIGYDSNNPVFMFCLVAGTTAQIKDAAFYDSGERILIHGGSFRTGADDAGMFFQNFAGANSLSAVSTGARLIKLK